MQKIFMSLLILGNCLTLCAMDKDKETQLKALDQDQQLAYYLNTLIKIDNITGKVSNLIAQGANVNRRVSTRDEGIKMVLREEKYSQEEIEDLASDAQVESWTPLISIAQRNYKPINGLEQRLITQELLHAGARVNDTYSSNGRPDMNGLNARFFAYQSKEFKDFTETLADFEYAQWKKELAERYRAHN